MSSSDWQLEKNSRRTKIAFAPASLAATACVGGGAAVSVSVFATRCPGGGGANLLEAADADQRYGVSRQRLDQAACHRVLEARDAKRYPCRPGVTSTRKSSPSA